MGIEATSETAPPVSNYSTEIRTDTHVLHVFLTRGLVAIAWAVVFAVVADSSSAGVTVGAGILLVTIR
jgi:hypothetical protein